MPVHNSDIAGILNRLADLLEIEGANVFRIRAYRNAARTIEGLPRSAESMLAEGEDLSELPGIGEDLAGKIREIVNTGTLAALDEIEGRVPGDLAALVALPGLGPKRVKALHDELGIQTLADLAEAAKAGKIRGLHGFGKKTEDHILQEIDRRTGAPKRFKLATAEEIAEPLLEYLRDTKGVRQGTIAGSYRRRKDTIGDLDILVTCGEATTVMDRFVRYPEAVEVLLKGKTKSTVRLRSGLQVDLRVVPAASYGAALQYFTGSKAHNIAVRTRAVKRGLKLNEYGLFKGEKLVAGRTEEEVYRKVGLAYIEPELRESRGEIEAAERGELPELVTLKDIRGDLHCHTKATDGRFSIEDMAEAAKERGYDYLAVTDHTRHVTIAHGLDAEQFAKQLDEIDRVNDRLKGITILKGAEVDILEDGTLDLPDDVLERLDVTIGAVHSNFNLSRAKQTERIIRAMDHPCFHILAHPTGRLLNEREPYEVDMEKLLKAALDRGCFLELNAQPVRLDLDDASCKLAKDLGVKIAINSDAHSVTDLDFMRFGIAQARRGWLEPGDVLNTRSGTQLKKLLKRS